MQYSRPHHTLLLLLLLLLLVSLCRNLTLDLIKADNAKLEALQEMAKELSMWCENIFATLHCSFAVSPH